MVKRLRTWLLHWLLHIAFDIAPDTNNGSKAKYLIGSYFDVFRK